MLQRASAALIALGVVLALSMQFYLNGAKPGLEPWGSRAWDLMRYFTILTNSLVGFVMVRAALGTPQSRHLHATAALNIAMVGIIFQLLLAPPEAKTGLDFWPDFLFHAGIPLASLLWWFAFAPRPECLRDVRWWMIWPVAYCIYILIRAQFDGNYVYFFLDIARFGGAVIARNILGLVLVFALFGCLMVLGQRLIRR
jgi:hypothetical protein